MPPTRGDRLTDRLCTPSPSFSFRVPSVRTLTESKEVPIAGHFLRFIQRHPTADAHPNRPRRRRKGALGAASAIALGLGAIAPSSAVGDTPHFGTVTVEDEAIERSGYTGGAQSFPGLFEQRDREGNPCLGFGDPLPDYRLVLNRDFDRLSLQVHSRSADTTLVVRGPHPDEELRCADDADASMNPALPGQTWEAGTYDVWVGTIEPGVQANYTLLVVPGEASPP